MSVEPIVAALVGAVAGTHVATWGMYKDSIHEGFTWAKYSRSIVIGALLGPGVQLLTALDPSRPAGAVVLFGLVYAAERVLVEFWKAFVREEDQSKYFIPMQLHVFGKLVTDRFTRWAVGGVATTFLVLTMWGVRRLQQCDVDVPGWVVVATAGSLGGWLTAFSGAWKDAPMEGFDLLKFFRSPAIALVWAALLYRFTNDWLYIGMAAAGYSAATIETYKTFFFPNRPRGKFAGKPILFPAMLQRRYRFVPLYAAIWVAIVLTFGAAFTT